MESPPDLYYSSVTGNTQLKGGAVNTGDNFIIEDLLDFSNDDVLADCTFNNGNSTDSSTVTVVDSCNSSFPSTDHQFSGSQQQQNFPESELCVPYDDMAELEWLSNFVEESFSSEDLQKMQLISGVKTEVSETTTRESSQSQSQPPETKRNNNPIFRSEMTVPGKARSKRSRAAPCNWSSRLLALSPTTSSSESETPKNSGKKTTIKLHKRKEISSSENGRKCLHCATDKTPQWRTGPMGPKTLCNACGVRYKSGRLVPEYRPASSPTFTLAKHSNSHRKVMELRRQKEMQRSQHEQFLYPNSVFDISGCADDYLIHHPTGSDFSQLI
ncbi:hypothetical protein ACHQM5_028711 [Ranunculus cassubicifolius]